MTVYTATEQAYKNGYDAGREKALNELNEFRNEVMSAFIAKCHGNDFNRLSLLTIGDTIDLIYEKYCLRCGAKMDLED